jgi:flagellar hook-associated protein 1 FlgK
MADLLSILSTSAASLAAQRAAIATTSHNIQNASTPGYARQRAVLETTLPAESIGNSYIGRGVSLETVQQVRDQYLEAQLPASFGQAARSSVAAGTLESVSALDPEARGGLSDALAGFYSALRQLSQNAGDLGVRQSALSAVGTLARTFNTTRGALEQARSGIDVRLAGSLDEVNSAAQAVARLNAEIRGARAGGAEPNDLLDARQKAVDRLAELTGAQPVPSNDGDVYVVLPGGTSLVAGNQAATLSAIADPANGGHLALRIAQPGAPPIALAAVGGELGGLLDARDGALKTAVTGLDQLAFDLAGAVNAAHVAGTGLDGVSGRPLLDAGATAAGAAARLAVAAAVAGNPRALAAATSAATLPGDGANALALVGTESALLSGGLDVTSSLSQITSAFGAATASARAMADQDAAIRSNLESARSSVSGVSIDDEMIELQKAQRAYEAVMKVMQTSNQMFETLMQLKS